MAKAQEPRASSHDKGPRSRDGIVVFAPHPDDEVLGCGGVLLRSRRARRSVRVVFLTNGDGFPKAAAALSGKDAAALSPGDFLAVARARQQGALDAARVLGLAPEDLVFLGYPDGGLARTLAATGDVPCVQEFTKKSCTYGLVGPDYHTQAHGKAAPYLRAALIGDVAELLRSLQPGEIYVTDAADGHDDHRVAFELVREAAAGFRGELYTYLIHSADGRWPVPRGATPGAPFETAGLARPPDDRRPMTREESALKLEAIRAYALEIRLAGPYVESFVKSEEVFWRRNL